MKEFFIILILSNVTNYPPNKIENCDIAKATARMKFISLSKLYG